MAKRKALVEDAMQKDSASENNEIPAQVPTVTGETEVQENPTGPGTSSSVPGEQDPTRNPDTTENSIFPQVTDIPGEAKDDERDPVKNDEQEADSGEIAESPEHNAPPSIEEVISALDSLLNLYTGEVKINLILRVQNLMKEHRSRM